MCACAGAYFLHRIRSVGHHVTHLGRRTSPLSVSQICTVSLTPLLNLVLCFHSLVSQLPSTTLYILCVMLLFPCILCREFSMCVLGDLYGVLVFLCPSDWASSRCVARTAAATRGTR